MKAKAPLVILAAVMFASCATSNFTPYEGAQQHWPVSQGALVDRKYAVPVYYGAPPRPYIVMGSLDIENATSGSEVEDAADEAKKLGADAVIVLSHGSSQGGTTFFHAGNVTYGVPVMRGAASVLAIRWRKA